MRSVSWVTAASFVVYNAILVLYGSGLPSTASYLYGLALFLAPFLVLLLAAWVGLPPLLARICAGVGLIFLAIVAGLAAINQATFVAPAFLMVYGAISVVILLLVVMFRVVRSAISSVKRT